MSWLTKRSQALIGGAVLMGLVNLIPGRDGATDGLPELDTMPRESVTRVVIAKGQTQRVVLEGDLVEGFQVTQPFQAPADTLALRSMLGIFQGDPIPMDLRVDQGNLEEYGVDDQSGILVELYDADGDTPDIAFVVGHDAGGGTSFVRLPGSDVVYRAEVGTRQRYDREPSQWRDRMVTQWEDVALERLDITRLEGEPISFVRVEDTWTSPQADFPVDDKTVDALADVLMIMRAGEVRSADTDGGWDPPAATVRLTTTEGDTRVLEFGTRQAGRRGAYVRVQGNDAVYVISAQTLARVLRGIDLYRNKNMFKENVAEVQAFQLDDELGRFVWERRGETEFVVTEPANVTGELMLMYYGLNTMASLRAVALEDIGWEQAGLDDPTMTVRYLMSDGSDRLLYIGRSERGDNGKRYWYAGRPELPGLVYVLDGNDVQVLREAFGRG